MSTRTKIEPVAKLYAKAIFELAKEKNEVEAVNQDFATLATMFADDGELKAALTSYTFSVADRMKLASEIAQKTQLHVLLARLMDLLVSKNRVQVIPNVYEAFRALLDESQNTVRGTVTTVETLTDAERADLSKAFERRLNKKVILDPVLDKEILGGLIVQLQGRTFDGSLKTTIRRLRESLERQSI